MSKRLLRELVGCNSAAYCTECTIPSLPLRLMACRITAVTVSPVDVISLPSIYWSVHPTISWSVISTFCAKRCAVLSRCDLRIDAFVDYIYYNPVKHG